MKSIGFGYYATKDGEIYSSKSGKNVAKRISHKGYFLVNLSINGRCKTFSLHRLIADAFIENKQNMPVVNHLDGNKLNNNVNNLEWTTFKENYRHAKENGMLNIARGLNTRFGKFTNDDVREIRRLLYLKYSWSEIAKKYNVTKSAIQQIAQRKTYYYVV